MNYESSAKQILNVLGKDNIQSATHCMTRLRFVLKDEAGIDDERVKKIPGVIYSEPKGAFYVMAKLPVDDAEKFQLFMLEEFDDNGDTLMFTPAESFYKTPHTGVNEIRMAYVINQDALKRSMELLAKGIEAYNNK